MAIVADQSRIAEGLSTMEPCGHIVRKSGFLALGGAVLASLLAISSTAAAGVVASESFETGLTPPAIQYGPDEFGFNNPTSGPVVIPNVTFSGFSGVITNGFEGIFANTSAGNQAAFLQFDSNDQAAEGVISWAISGLNPGQKYVLSFEDAGAVALVGADPIGVSIFGGAPVEYQQDMIPSVFTTQTLEFTASTANGSIDFLARPLGTQSFTAIDDLKISTAPGVPEPATWAMMLVGFGGLGAAMRRSRRRVARALA